MAKRVYGAWAGKPQGTPEDETLCIESVCRNERGAIPRQCSRKRGHGPEGLYCGGHAQKFENKVIATWYKTDQWSFKIEPVQVLKETPDRLLIKTLHGSESTKKNATFGRYWPTYAEALEHLRKRLDAARSNLKRDEAAFKKLVDKA